MSALRGLNEAERGFDIVIVEHIDPVHECTDRIGAPDIDKGKVVGLGARQQRVVDHRTGIRELGGERRRSNR
jgi:hypothetical protein